MNRKSIGFLSFGILFSVMFSSVSLQGYVVISEPPFDSTVNGATLTIITKYDVSITEEFEERFLATDEAISLNITDIEFRHSSTDEGWKTLLEDPSKSIDIAWGGGNVLFNKMYNFSLLYPISPINDSYLFSIINDTVPYFFGGSQMKQYTDEGEIIWSANTATSIGFIVNHDFLDLYGLPMPTTWEALATRAYYLGNNSKSIALLDSPQSSMHSTIYQIILQIFGWEDGWKILTRIGANSDFCFNLLYSPRQAIIDGEVGVVFTYDFLGRSINRENPSCEYIIPDGQSLILGDLIAIAKNVDDYDAAVAFMEYIYSPEGLSTWLIEGLERLPINETAFHTPEGSQHKDIYEVYNRTIWGPDIFFSNILAEITRDICIYYFHNTITQNYDLLRKTWGKMIDQFNAGNITGTEFLELKNILGSPSITLGEAIAWNSRFSTDSEFAENLVITWKNTARNQYKSILDFFSVETTSPSTSMQISLHILTIAIAVIIMKTMKFRNRIQELLRQ